jgi:hypothetical protein
MGPEVRKEVANTTVCPVVKTLRMKGIDSSTNLRKKLRMSSSASSRWHRRPRAPLFGHTEIRAAM